MFILSDWIRLRVEINVVMSLERLDNESQKPIIAHVVKLTVILKPVDEGDGDITYEGVYHIIPRVDGNVHLNQLPPYLQNPQYATFCEIEMCWHRLGIQLQDVMQ